MTSKGNQIDNDVKKFLEFMKAKYLKKNDKTGEYPKRVTHTLLGILHETSPYRGCFHISGKDYDRFLQLYKSVYGKIPLHLVERPNETGNMVGPYIVDIDYKTNHEDRIYEKKHFESIIKICNKIFNQYLDVDKSKLKAYVLEKDSPSYDTKNKNYKDGFHVHYNIPLSVNKRLFFFEKIKEEIIKQDIFGDIEQISDYDDIVDESVMISNGVLMFGSQKEGRNPYKLTGIYDSKINEEDVDDYDDPDFLIGLFSLQQYTDDEDTEFIDKYKDKEKELNEKPYSREDKKKKEVKKIEKDNGSINNSNTKTKYSPDNPYSLNNLPDEYKNVFDMVDMLSVSRAKNFTSWVSAGIALYNISPRLYNVYIHFSKKAPNFDEDACYNIWTSAKKYTDGPTISSLKFWAKEDNPKEYEEKFLGKLRELVLKIENPNHDELANIIYEMYGDTYKCASITKNSWFEFQNHRWVYVDSAYTLQEKISSEVAKQLHQTSDYLYNKISQENNGLQKDFYKKQTKNLWDTILKLKDQNYSTTLIKACARKFHDPKFEENLDSNPYLIGFENGVFDLRLEEITDEDGNKRKVYVGFRKGMPEDKLTFTTGYDYVEYSEDDKIVDNIDKFIKKIQPQDDMREYVLRLFASCLDGKNRDQQFRIFTGHGSNGKSKLIDLLSAALGDYGGVLKPTFLTTKDNNPEGATPSLSKTKGKRFIALQEPEGDSSIQVGKMKGLTGGDKIITRGLFQGSIEFVPQFKMILVCNKLPKIPSDDGGTWRRIRATPFKSKFVKSKNEVNHEKHHYLADLSIDEEKMKEWAPAFMWMLLNIYYVRYIQPNDNGGLQEPEEVKEYTEKYRKESDILFEFIRENVKLTDNEADTEKITTLFDMFKDWHRDFYNQSTRFSRKDLEEYLVEKMGIKVSKGLVYKVKGTWENLCEEE
jgi:P4 family phage/plasmid primase-like protien